METEILKLSVEQVIGTGDPFDQITLILLISDWGVPNNCLWNLKEECEETLSRLYVLDKPVDNHKIIGICEKHHKIFKKDTQ